MACPLPDHPACLGLPRGVKSTGEAKPAEKTARVGQHLITNVLRDNPFFVTPLPSPAATGGRNICVCAFACEKKYVTAESRFLSVQCFTAMLVLVTMEVPHVKRFLFS